MMNKFQKAFAVVFQYIFLMVISRMSRLSKLNNFATFDELEALDNVPLSPPPSSCDDDEEVKCQDSQERKTLTLQVIKQQQLFDDDNSIVKPVEISSLRGKRTTGRLSFAEIVHSTLQGFCHFISNMFYHCLLLIRPPSQPGKQEEDKEDEFDDQDSV